jgi:hypothetical protein
VKPDLVALGHRLHDDGADPETLLRELRAAGASRTACIAILQEVEEIDEAAATKAVDLSEKFAGVRATIEAARDDLAQQVSNLKGKG